MSSGFQRLHSSHPTAATSASRSGQSRRRQMRANALDPPVMEGAANAVRSADEASSFLTAEEGWALHGGLVEQVLSSAVGLSSASSTARSSTWETALSL